MASNKIPRICKYCGKRFLIKPSTLTIANGGSFCSRACTNRSRARPRPHTEGFWEKVNKTDTCWLWTHTTNGCGYGIVARTKDMRYAHRMSWEMQNGPIPEGMCILHTCDNPPCVNPGHLRLGTHAENMLDKTQKGRAGYQKGSACHKAKLTDDEVRDMRRRFAAGETYKSLGLRFGVTHSTAYYIVTKRSWKHLD